MAYFNSKNVLKLTFKEPLSCSICEAYGNEECKTKSNLKVISSVVRNFQTQVSHVLFGCQIFH